MSDSIRTQISKLRREVIVHRILYYVYSHPIISDQEYDLKERALRVLCDSYPDAATEALYFAICPTITVGSELEESYPPELVMNAEELLADVS